MPEAWENKTSARFMPKRYTSRELVKLAEELGWRLVGVRGSHHNYKYPASPFIAAIVHPQKDVPTGASGGYGEEN
jgi:predicted RNA binding protein YcfA (HicA-like mRNA interferase family)